MICDSTLISNGSDLLQDEYLQLTQWNISVQQWHLSKSHPIRGGDIIDK